LSSGMVIYPKAVVMSNAAGDSNVEITILGN
jgi:hypothetical protein